LECDEGGDTCGCAFGVTILDHDSAKDFGGVYPFHPFAAAGQLVRGETAVGVLEGEEDVDCVLETGFGD
jgi:hypothetical protein